MTNKRELGTKKEILAAEFLTANGIKIIEYNFRCKQGEVDLIGYDKNVCVFFEVKYRSGSSYGSSLDAVDYRKQNRICRVSDYYRYIHKFNDLTPIRFDVIGIDGNRISWIENAFQYI